MPHKISLGRSHPLAITTHRPYARLVRVVVRSTGCTAVKTHLPARWGVGSRHLCRLICAVLILPLPRLLRGSLTTCCRACLLLLWARMRISRYGLQNVRNRRVCSWSPHRCECRPARAKGESRLTRFPLRVLTPLNRRRATRSSTGGAPPIY